MRQDPTFLTKALVTSPMQFLVAAHTAQAQDSGAERSPKSWRAAKAPSRHVCTAGANDYELCCEPHTNGAIVTRRILLRAFVLLASWAIGLLVAAWIVPRVSLSVPGFIVAVLAFAVTQAILSLSILKLPYRYASLLLGGTGLALTIVALILASVLTHGLAIDGMASWLATTVVVWLVTTIGAITLPELLIGAGAGST